LFDGSVQTSLALKDTMSKVQKIRIVVQSIGNSLIFIYAEPFGYGRKDRGKNDVFIESQIGVKVKARLAQILLCLCERYSSIEFPQLQVEQIFFFNSCYSKSFLPYSIQ